MTTCLAASIFCGAAENQFALGLVLSKLSVAGNVAIDVALTALRQGARHVDLTLLEKRREMPASPHEIELAVAEGVQLHPGWGPVRFEDDGEAVFQFCSSVKDESGTFDQSSMPTVCSRSKPIMSFSPPVRGPTWHAWKAAVSKIREAMLSRTRTPR